MNIEQARFNMIEQQIRPWEVLDQQVLDLISNVPREEFVPSAYRHFAFTDTSIPIAHDQVMMFPKIEGRLLQALMLHSNDTVLEIGTGSGYLTALLAKSARHVDSVDIFEDLVKGAVTQLKALNINNVSLNIGDASKGWNTDTRYDVIVLTGSVPVLKSHFLEQLHCGGCLFAIVGKEPAMQALLINRIGENEFDTEVLFETSLPPLVGVSEPERFVL
ncbi:MAG: protein-L-isoaspartate O-methyltransferase [Gammaproteobacteria bacterium]|nr:MAG: protein-L-isoaspartate O-methyltransferase [Gammaproteobacteria bacterium]RKZ39992.1 MAG: protein-L-isoaspartate O-methyltransferase [Gammaproteobacteria bacterium]RKZ73611.1 MAG: protein-L-isoaspartate O-methyltransferase [Gammaproteobacteria bacterium]